MSDTILFRLSDFRVTGFGLLAICRVCRRGVEAPVRSLAAKYGATMTLIALEAKLYCRHCNHPDPALRRPILVAVKRERLKAIEGAFGGAYEDALHG
jgi:hypothetical protein